MLKSDCKRRNRARMQRTADHAVPAKQRSQGNAGPGRRVTCSPLYLKEKGEDFEMMTLRENMTAIYNHEQPDFYGDLMDAIELLPDPILMGGIPPQDGKFHKNQWGVTYIFRQDEPGPQPYITPDNLVIKDIENWERDLKVPSLEGLDWGPAKKVAESTDRKEKFVGVMFGGGLFETSHFLMGMENALVNYLEYPDEMKDFLTVIKDWKIAYIRQMTEEVHPDIIFYHDDWGSKRNVFLPPRVWREIIKPLQQEISDAIHNCGMIYMHHADCICQPLVTDMVDIGVDIWQGAIPQNDIVEIQKVTKGKLAMVGGVDGPAIDIEGIPEEKIRAEVHRAIDTYCPGGRFFPGIANGVCFIERNNRIYRDELAKYGRQYALEHPIR